MVLNKDRGAGRKPGWAAVGQQCGLSKKLLQKKQVESRLQSGTVTGYRRRGELCSKAQAHERVEGAAYLLR